MRYRLPIVARASIALLGSLLMTSGVPARADAPDAGEIMRRSERVRSPDLDYAVDFTLVVSNPKTIWKERRARYTMIAHRKDHTLVLMREPKQFYSGTLLIMRNLYWLLFPRSDKPIQLSARNILNGDIANGDLARGDLLTHYEARLDGQEKVDGRRCWRLELQRTSNIAHYPRIRAWIDKRKERPVKFEYYGQTGSLLRTVHYGDYRDGAIGVRAMRIEVENQSRPGEGTVMEFSDLRLIDAGAFPYTTEGMLHFRDAAKAFQAAEGRQATPEDLLIMLNGAPK